MSLFRPYPPTIREISAAIFQSTTKSIPTCKHIHPLHTTSRLSHPPLHNQTTSKKLISRASSKDRGPRSEETTQTDFGNLDILNNTPVPSTSIDACAWDGFHLNSGVKVTEGKGVLLIAGEAFAWAPWLARDGGYRLLNGKGQWEVGDESWGVLGLVWPKPDLLILGLGPKMAPLSPATRAYINSLGIRVDVQDTRNASAQFNLLAMERGVGSVAAALIPMGFREGIGAKKSNPS